MSRVSSSEAVRAAEVPTPKGFPVGRIVIVVGLLAFAALLGVRVRTAMKTRDELSMERQQQANAAAAHPQGAVAGQASAVAGVPETWTPEVAFEGTLSPAREADLGFMAMGRLSAIRVRLGERVSAGQVLAVLEQVDAQAQLNAAAAGVRAAEAQVAIADDASRRTNALIESGSMPSANGVQVNKQLALATAQLDGARAQVALADAALKNHTLTAGFGGVITRVPSGTGGIVAPGVPLFHVQDVSTLKLSGTIGDADIALVRPGSIVEIKADGRSVKGRIVAVLSMVDAATRRVPIEAEVKNDGPAPLLGGTFVRSSVTGLAPVPVLRLPAATLRPGSQREVMVVKSGHLEARHITYATAADGSLLVRGGLSQGERVLLSPSAEARDGDVVTLTDAAPAAAAKSPAGAGR